MVLGLQTLRGFNHLLKQGDTIFSSVDPPCSHGAAVDGKTTAAEATCLCSECLDGCRTFCTRGLFGNGRVIQDPNEILVVQPLSGSNFTVKARAQALQSCPTRLSATPWTQPARLLCPWDFPGKHTGVGCHALPQVIFPTQGLNSHCRQILCTEPPGKPIGTVNKELQRPLPDTRQVGRQGQKALHDQTTVSGSRQRCRISACQGQDPSSAMGSHTPAAKCKLYTLPWPIWKLGGITASIPQGDCDE